MANEYISGWNSALEMAAFKLQHEFKQAFGDDTLSSISVYIKGLKKEEVDLPRPWIGLTDEDKQIAFDDTQEGGGFWEFADAIEAKLKEKNT